MTHRTLPSDIAPEFWDGVEQFNQREFYACHDTLEAIWMEAMEPQRSLYQGILQLAVALYHLGNQNLRGAVILLGEGSRRLQVYTPTYGGIDIAGLLSQSAELLALLQQAQLHHTQNPQLGSSEPTALTLEIPALTLPTITLVDSEMTPMPG